MNYQQKWAFWEPLDILADRIYRKYPAINAQADLLLRLDLYPGTMIY